jgi:hypothetical protein
VKTGTRELAAYTTAQVKMDGLRDELEDLAGFCWMGSSYQAAGVGLAS